MKISFNSPKNSIKDLDPYHGFGYAGANMLINLKELGYEVEFNDPTAEIGFIFNHPSQAKFYPHQYNILYFPWESTEVQKGWKEVMDACDEIWTPSPWCAGVFMNITDTPVYVYEHGVEHSWIPVRRKVKDRLMFLNQGGEAARKRSFDVRAAFGLAFPGKDDVGLTMKMWNPALLTNDGRGNVKSIIPAKLGRIEIINRDMALPELQKLYHQHHAFVYPSAGEGFGLTPLQALATGMPTITLADWAPYANFLDPNLTLHGKLVATDWPKIHPGKVYTHSQDELIDHMRYVYYYYDELAQEAFDRAEEIHKTYDWKRLTRRAFSDLKSRLQ